MKGSVFEVFGRSVVDREASCDRLPAYVTRQRNSWLIYFSIVLASAGLAMSIPSRPEIQTALLGLTFPGAGFLNWAMPDQVSFASLLFVASLAGFTFALLLWFATGNVVAPVATWIGLAVLAARPDVSGGIAQDQASLLPWLIAPGVLLFWAATWLRSAFRRPKEARVLECYEPASHQLEAKAKISSQEDQKRLRLLLERALQPVEEFNGFERRDQFQTAALRYQVNFTAYAIASAKLQQGTDIADDFEEAQRRLIVKIGDHRLWSYWKYENAWGKLRLGADPISNQNIMYSGFTLLQLALSGASELKLHSAGQSWRTYSLDSIADRLAEQYRASKLGLLECEPNWVYPLCNLITAVGIKAADVRTGGKRWERLAEPFFSALEREGTSADGSFIAFRSSLIGLAPSAPGGIVMQAFPCLFLNALSPAIAQQHWSRVRQRLDEGSWSRLFWPIDVGNYGFSRASSYAATAAAAVEMGDTYVATECLRRLEIECPSREIDGAIHRENASLWAHALEVMARYGRANGFRDLILQSGG